MNDILRNKLTTICAALLTALLMITAYGILTEGAHAEGEEVVDYDIWVGGVQVTSENASGVTGDNIQGTVTYDATSNKLALSDVAIVTEGPKTRGIRTEINGLTIELTGTNTITADIRNSGGSNETRAIDSNGDLTITGSGTLDIVINNNDTNNENREQFPKGIAANNLIVDETTVSISINGGKSYDFNYPDGGSGNSSYVVAGIFVNQVTISNSIVDIEVHGEKDNTVAGIYCFNDVDLAADIAGRSEVNISILKSGQRPCAVVTGITGRYSAASPIDGRKFTSVRVQDTSVLNIDTTGVTATISNGGIYGQTQTSGNSTVNVKAGADTSGTQVSYGIGVWPQKVYPTSTSGDQYIVGLKAGDNSVVEMEGINYGTLSSIETSGNANVSIVGGQYGTNDYQGVKAGGDSKLYVRGGEYGISGTVMAEDNAVVEASGGTKAIRGRISPSATTSGNKPFEPSLDNEGLVVHITNHNRRTAEVKTSPEASETKEWNGSDLLGGEDSLFTYVRIPYHEHNWGEWTVITPATTSVEGEKTRSCTICGKPETRAIPKLDPVPSGGNGSADSGSAGTQNAVGNITSVTVNSKTVSASAVDAAVAAAGGSEKYVTEIVLGSKVKKIKKGSFNKYTQANTLIVKTKKLKKSSVKKSLRGSQITKVKVKVGKKKVNKKYVKKYKKIFKKKNSGKKVKVS